MKFNKYVIISYAILIITIIIGYIYITDLKQDIEVKNDAILKERQNVYALKDQINMKADSIQLFATMVNGLQTDISRKNNEYNVLYSKYNAALDTIKVLKGKTNPPTETDSTIIVPFSGAQGIAKYDGYTVYYKKTKLGEYSLIIAFEPIQLQSEIYFDSKDSLLKNKIQSLTAGVKIDSAKTIVDPQIYTMIRKASQDCPEVPTIIEPNFLDNFGFSLSLSQKIKYSNDHSTFEPLDLDLGVFYKINKFTLFTNKSILKNEFKFGINYGLRLRNIFDSIF